MPESQQYHQHDAKQRFELGLRVAHWIVGVDGTHNLTKITMTSLWDCHNLQEVRYRQLFWNQNAIPEHLFLHGIGRRIYSTDDNPLEFEKFWNQEQVKAFLKLVDDENLSKERTQALIEHYI